MSVRFWVVVNCRSNEGMKHIRHKATFKQLPVRRAPKKREYPIGEGMKTNYPLWAPRPAKLLLSACRVCCCNPGGGWAYPEYAWLGPGEPTRP